MGEDVVFNSVTDDLDDLGEHVEVEEDGWEDVRVKHVAADGYEEEEKLASRDIVDIALKIDGKLKFKFKGAKAEKVKEEKKLTFVPLLASDNITAAVYPINDINMHAPIAFLLCTCPLASILFHLQTSFIFK